MDNYFSHNLKLLRKRSGLSLEALASKIGCGKSVLGQYEQGKSEPTMSILMEISRYFGISLSDLTEKEMRSNYVIGNTTHSNMVNESFERMYSSESKRQINDTTRIDELLKTYGPDQLAKIAHDLLVENKALKEAFEFLGKGLKSK